jgi:hypothetical protein
MHQKDQKLPRGRWPQCERKILVIILMDASIGAITPGTETDTPDEEASTRSDSLPGLWPEALR